MHIVEAAMSDEDAARIRLQWEAEQLRLQEEQRQRHSDELAQRDAFERIGWATREHLTQKLAALIESLDPYVDGTMGEVTAGMVSVYVKTVHELGALYGLQKPLRPVTPLPVTPEPPAVLGHEEEQARQRVAVEAAVAAGKRQLADVKRRMLGS